MQQNETFFSCCTAQAGVEEWEEIALTGEADALSGATAKMNRIDGVIHGTCGCFLLRGLQSSSPGFAFYTHQDVYECTHVIQWLCVQYNEHTIVLFCLIFALVSSDHIYSHVRVCNLNLILHLLQSKLCILINEMKKQESLNSYNFVRTSCG